MDACDTSKPVGLEMRIEIEIGSSSEIARKIEIAAFRPTGR